jgi:hypothetical protein
MADYDDERVVQDPDEHWADLSEDDWRLLHRNDDGEGGAGAAAPLSSPSPAIYSVVSHIVSRGVDFDYQDVLELGVDGVLDLYDVSADLTVEEREHLRDVLLSLGGRVQTREMARLALAEDPLLEVLLRKPSVQPLRSRQAGLRNRLTGAAELRSGPMNERLLAPLLVSRG